MDMLSAEMPRWPNRIVGQHVRANPQPTKAGVAGHTGAVAMYETMQRQAAAAGSDMETGESAPVEVRQRTVVEMDPALLVATQQAAAVIARVGE